MMVDRLVALAALLSAIYMALRGPAEGINDLLPGGATASMIYLACAVAIPAGLWRIGRRSRGVRWFGRAPLYLAATLLVMIAMGRSRTIAWIAEGRALPEWPPLAAKSRAGHLDALTPAERAGWAVHVAAHRWSESTADSTILEIPETWPFPSDVEVARRRDSDSTLQVWARASDGTAACLTIPSIASRGADSIAHLERCERVHQAPSGLPFAAPIRRAGGTGVATLNSSDARPPGRPAWRQYRRDAVHAGIAPTRDSGRMTGFEWATRIDGPVRASATVVGDLVLIGAHFTGEFAALDLRTGMHRWAARAPNWIHQDAVSDGRIVVVGFGNKWPSFAGRAPSGVAAYAIESGRSLWTAFDESSVMTSALIRDSVVVYVTAAGTLRKRSIETGTLLAARQLPGGVIMGPPVATGDTLAVALDENGLCAVLISTFEALWCRDIPGMRMLGHAAPTIADGMVLVSGPGKLRAASLRDLRAHPLSTQLRYLWQAFGPEDGYVGQGVKAFDLRDGTSRWSTRLFTQDTGQLSGHSSGTATIAGTVGLILLPFADSLVAFDVRTGTVRWTAWGRHARGAPLVVDGHVIVAGRDGVIETRDVETGTLSCSMTEPLAFDRAGPTLSGETLVFTALDGTILARPKSQLVECGLAEPPQRGP